MANQVGEINVKIGADTAGLNSGVDSAKSKLSGLSKSTDDASRSATGFTEKSKTLGSQLDNTATSANTAFRAIGALAAAVGAFTIAKGIYDTSAEFQSLSVQLEVATGSAADARLAFDALNKLSSTLPESVTNMTNAFIKMKNLGLQPTTESLVSFSNTAAAQSKDIMQFVEAVADAATGEFERLKEFGIKVSQSGEEVALTFKGVSTTIKNDAESITKYLVNIGNTDFAGSATKQMETLSGLASNSDVAVQNLYSTFGAVGGIEVAGSAIKTFTVMVDNLNAAIKNSSEATSGNAESMNGLVSMFNTAAGVTNDIGNAFSGLAEKVGLLYAILATEINMDTFDNIGGYIEDYKVNMAKLEENSRLFWTGLEKGADTTKLEEVATVLDKIAVSGGIDSKTGKTEGVSKAEEKAIEAQQQKLYLLEQEWMWQTELSKFTGEAAIEARTEKDMESTQLKLEALQTQYLSENELLIAKYEEQQLIIDEALLNEQISAEEHQQFMTDIAKKGADARLDLDKKEAEERSRAMSGMMNNLSSLMNSGSKEMFEIGKVAATTNAVMAGYEAAVHSFNAGAKIGGPAVGAAFAAASVAATAVQISQIQSQSFGSGATGGTTSYVGGVPAVNTAAAASSPTGGTLTVEGLSASSLFTGDAVQAIANELLDYQRSGGQVVLQG